MSDNGFKVKNKINIKPGGESLDAEGDIAFNSTSHKLEVRDNSATRSMVSEDGSATLTNKSISGSTNTLSNIPASAVNTGAATTSDIATSNTDSTVNIGTGTGANVVNIGGANTTVNITGTVNNQAVTNLNVSDKLITINDGGAAASGGSSGIEIEEDGSATGYIQTHTDRASWKFKAPSTNGVATLTPGASNDDVVLAAASQTLTNKTLTSPTVNTPTVDIMTLDGQASAPSNPSSGFYKLYVDDTSGKAKLLNSAGIATTIGSGGGGGKNYLTDGDAEGANPWTMYDDAAATPVDGTGGTTSATVTISSTNPLTGLSSFIFTPHSSLGEGAAYAFTLDREDKYKLLHCDLSYEVASGTYASGDLAVYLYDVTNARLISPFSTHLLANVAIPSTQRFTFQATDSTSYRLLIHQVTTNSGYTIKFEAKLGPKDFAGYATVQTDFASYTPTFTTVTASNIDVKYAIDGERIKLIGRFSHTGGTGGLTMTLPGGYTIKSTDTASPNYRVCGTGSMTTTTLGSVTVLSQANLQTVTFGFDGGTGGGNVPYTGTWGSETITFSAEVYVNGLSSSAPLISEYDGRVVAAAATGDAASATSGNIIIFPTVSHDTHNAYNNSTGRFTCPVSGYFRVHGFILSATNGGQIELYKNGSSVKILGQTDTNGECAYTGTVYGTAGDILDIRASGATIDAGVTSTVHFEMLSGAQQIQAGHVVAMRVGGNPASASANSPIIFPTISFDYANGYNATTGEYTIKANGIYRVGGILNGTNYTGGEGTSIYKNGSSEFLAGVSNNNQGTTLSGIFEGKVGDVITLVNSNGVARDVDGTSHWTLELIGSHLIDQKVSPKVVQTVLSTSFTNATNGSYVAVTGLSATTTVSSGQSVLVKCSVTGDPQNNYGQMYHIYRDGSQLTPNGPNNGYTPSGCYAFLAGGLYTTSTTHFEFLDTTASGTHTYQVYAAKPSVAATGISINPAGTALYGGSSSITLQVM